MYYQPRVIYRDPAEIRKNSVIKYIGNRVLGSNKNFLCALVGQTGVGKSWAGLAMCEDYSHEFNIPFDPKIHVVSTLKQILKLINDKKLLKTIQNGTPILFEEPQVEANARNWRAESNKMLSTLISTFRNQRLVVFFTTPFLEMVDKQSRILFHGEFKVLGYDKSTGITTIKPRFLEYNKTKDDFYRKMLVVEYAIPEKSYHAIQKINKWHIERASGEITDIYEAFKKEFTDELNKKMLRNIIKEEEREQHKNKHEELLEVKELYDKHGENYFKILEKMPYVTPFVLEKYIRFIKKSANEERVGNPPT